MIKSRVIHAIAAMLIVTVATSASAQTKEYRRMPIIGGGYKDKQRTANRWYVRGFSLGFQALPLAMYRGALLVKKAGFSHMQVVKTNLVMTYGFMVPTSQNAKLEIVGARAADTPLVCENKKRNINLCRTYSVDDVIRQAGAELGRTGDQMAADLAAV